MPPNNSDPKKAEEQKEEEFLTKDEYDKIRLEVEDRVKEIGEQLSTNLEESKNQLKAKDGKPEDRNLNTGSGGVLYGVYRYIMLLKQEDKTKLSAHLNVVEWRMNSAIESNINLVSENKPETEQCASFLRSETVGIYSLVILHMLTKKKEEIELEKIQSIVREKIITAQP